MPWAFSTKRGLEPGTAWQVRRVVDDNLSGREDNSLKVYQLLTLELWHEQFVDR